MTGATTRRAFLGTLVAVAATATGVTRPWRFVVAVARRPVEVRLARLFGDEGAAAAIGRAAALSDSTDSLVRSLATRLAGGLAEADAVGDDVLRRAAARAVADDFAAGATVVVDGWVLARTEVELCALAARATG